jgi:hypothetical protein
MPTKERFQNPNCGDDLNLRLFAFNSNFKSNFYRVEKVEIYFLDPYEKTEDNPTGKRLVETVDGEDVDNPTVGEYLATVNLESPLYTIGKYLDVWYVKFEESEPCTESTVENYFEVIPNLWFTSTSPNIYDFSFYFKPNKVTKGSKRYIIIEVVPNVPKSEDLQRYYDNIAITSGLKIYLSKNCSNCLEEESDLNTTVDGENVSLREKRFGYYFLDTTDIDVGLYDIWFELTYAENIFVSDKNQIQIY